MRQYAIKRVALFIPTVLLLTIIVFTLMSIIPGDTALAILSDGEGAYTQKELDDLLGSKKDSNNHDYGCKRESSY